MDQLPSKSLSKSILIATPLFCIVIALLDAADDLSYLFVLQFLGSVDIMFIPTTQPEVRSVNFNRDQAFKSQGININNQIPQATNFPLVQFDTIQSWANNHSNIRGVSPRWIVPVSLPRTDSLLLITNITHELSMGVGEQSNLQKLGLNQIALPRQLLSKLGLKVGNSIDITLSIPGLLQGAKVIQKYQSFQSREEYVVDSPELNINQISELIYGAVSSRGKEYNLTITKDQVHSIVQQIYQTQFTTTFTIKYQYRNKGLHPTTLHNVVLMGFEGFSSMLTQLFVDKVINSKPIQDKVFELLQKADVPKAQIFLIRTYFRTVKTSPAFQEDIRKNIQQGIKKFPLLVISTFKNRELVYSPDEQGIIGLLDAMQSSPGQFQVVSIYPFYQDLEGIRFFFKSVIQIFTFICAVIYYYIMTLIFRQIYEEKEIEVGIWRTLGAGGVKTKNNKESSIDKYSQFKELKQTLTLSEKLNYGYKMLVKVGFLYYWLVSAVISAFLFWLTKQLIYNSVSSMFFYDSPPQKLIYVAILLFAIITFTVGLAILHIRQIYINPLVSTIKPVKRTFDLVKVRIIKIATFGITVETFIIAIMLIYYGVVSYYEIPMSILYNDGWLQTILFNSIFLFMIFGAIILLSVLQSRMQCLILEGLFKISERLNRTKLIILKTIKAKQYKNIKVSIIISIIFAFLLFFASGLKIEAMIVQSFIQRQLGAELVLQNYQKNTFNKETIQDYLNKVNGVKYSWLSNDLDNKKVEIQFQGITKSQPITAIFKIISSNYLDTTFYQYYYPQKYFSTDVNNYEKLPNGVYNGFNSIFTKQGGSIGHFDPSDTIKEYDPNHININGNPFAVRRNSSTLMAPQQQVVNLVVTSSLRKKLGASTGDYFKLHVKNAITGVQYMLRCRVMHSLKIGPGLDLFSNVAFFTQEQAQYLYSIVGVNQTEIKYQKLFVSGKDLSAVGNKILSISPEHTQMFEMGTVRESFQTMQAYLQGLVALVTVILASLSILFLFIYTYGKCKQEAEVFKMLRAIGLSVFDIRLIVFIQILIRIVVSIFNGILLGIVFSLGLSGQIQEVLMINTPPIKLNTIFIIAFLMLALFAVTVTRSTSYLTTRTVLQTSKGQ